MRQRLCEIDLEKAQVYPGDPGRYLEHFSTTNRAPAYAECRESIAVNISQKQHRITPSVGYSAKNAVYDIQGRHVPNSVSGSEIFIDAESARSCRIRLPAIAGQ